MIPVDSFKDRVQYGYLTVIKCIRSYNYGICAFNGYVITAIKNNFGYLLRSDINHYNEVPDKSILNKAEGLSISIEDHMIAYEEVK